MQRTRSTFKAAFLHYGSEWDASLSWPFGKGVAGLLKVADYNADGHARDTRKLWLQLEYKGKR